MQAEFIFRVQASDDIARKLFHMQSNFLNKIYDVYTLNVVIETYEDGSLYFFGNYDDFEKLFQIYTRIMAKASRNITNPVLSDQPIDATITKIKIPSNISFTTLVPIITQAFLPFSDEIKVVHTSDTAIVIRFERGPVLEAWLHHIENELTKTTLPVKHPN